MLYVEDEAKRYLKGPFYYYGLDVECSLKVHHLGVTILRDVVKLSSWHGQCHLGVRAAVITCTRPS